MPLDPGMKFTALGMNPEDAQLLETRGFHVEELCRWFGVPPMLIGHSAQGQTMWGSGIEQIMLAWLTTALARS
jgi:phage portal protein BeeE